jgi:DnaJ-class molecular chaperone
VLETSERATLEEVKAAYRAKVQKYHPDKVNNSIRGRGSRRATSARGVSNYE